MCLSTVNSKGITLTVFRMNECSHKESCLTKKTGHIVLRPISRRAFHNTSLHWKLLHLRALSPPSPSEGHLFKVIENNHNTDFHLWAVTRISKVCRAIYSKWQQSINHPRAAPSVRQLQALQFLCHPVYAYQQYVRRNSFSLCCTSDRIPFNTHYASTTVYYARQGQRKEGE